MLYTLSLLTLLTRIQLNLLGRRTYLSSVVSLANPPPATDSSRISLENNDDDNYDNVYGNDFETNRKYLTFSWWLLHKGSKEIVDKVGAAVKEVFGPLNPREDLTLERLSHLILEVRKRVEGATETERREHKWLSYMLPPHDQEDFVLRESGIDAMPTSPAPQEAVQDPLHSPTSASSNTSLRRLLDETSDLIDSPTFTHVFTQLLNAAFSHLVDYHIATDAFKISPPAPDSLSRVTEISDKKCKLAQTLAVFCRQAHVIAAGSSEPDDLAVVAESGTQLNEYLAAIDQVKDLEAFAAVIYSTNFEYEAAEQEQQHDNVAQSSARDAPTDPIPAAPASAEDMDDVWSRSRTTAAAEAPTYADIAAQAPSAPSTQQEEQSTMATSTIPPLTLIVAATAKNGIGKNGGLPWPMLKKEMAYFARVTKRVPGLSTKPEASMISDASSQLSDSSETAATLSEGQTAQNVVVMGRKTWESIPPKFRPLPARTNVVISRSESVAGAGPDVVVAKDITTALSTLSSRAKSGAAKPLGRVFVIGGGAIYKAALELEAAKHILLTRVEGEWDCDTEFPVDVDESSSWVRREKGELDDFVGEEVQERQEEEGKDGSRVDFEFRLYQKV